MAENPDDIAAAVKASHHELLSRLALGAEPFWMQNVRCATRQIEAERVRIQAARRLSASDSAAASND